jgi:predicted nucleotidyltransferase
LALAVRVSGTIGVYLSRAKSTQPGVSFRRATQQLPPVIAGRCGVVSGRKLFDARRLRDAPCFSHGPHVLTIVIYHRIVHNYPMKQAVKAELGKLIDIIVQTLPVERIILFGSYAYGVPRKDSDQVSRRTLDIYVVLKEGVEMREIDAMIAIGQAMCRKKTMPVDIIVGKPATFAKRKCLPTIERKIDREGVILYG